MQTLKTKNKDYSFTLLAKKQPITRRDKAAIKLLSKNDKFI